MYRAAGFTGPQGLEVPAWTVTRTVEEVVASVYSLSGSAPHLFGDHLGAFDVQLRALLAGANAVGVFTERMPPVILDIWR